MKKFVTLMMACLMVFALVACDSGDAELKKAQESVTSLVTAIKKIDQSAIQGLTASAVELGEEIPKEEVDPAYEAIYDKFDLIYESGDIDAKATQATLKYKSLWPAMDEETFFDLIEDDGTDPKEKLKDVEIAEIPVDIQLVKEGDTWKILNVDEVMSSGLWW